MEIKDEKEHVYFESFCNNAHEAALLVGRLIDKKLSGKELNDSEKKTWATYEFNQVCEKINSFERPEYFDNLSDINVLYDLFRTRGKLYNTEELNKLEQAMNMYEKFKCLKIALVNITLMEERLKKQKNNPVVEKNSETAIDLLAFNQMMIKLDNYIHIVKPPSRIGDFVKLATCHNWKEEKNNCFLACKINEFKCIMDGLYTLNKDLTYANIGRNGIFISRKKKPIKPHHLTTSSYEKLKTRADIQNIIAEYIKKVGHV